MGPRLVSRGDAEQHRDGLLDQCLQWGRGWLAAGTVSIPVLPAARLAFNGAAAG